MMSDDERMRLLGRISELEGKLAEAVRSPVPVGASTARTMIAARRRIERYFRPHLFGDPVFDILLELYASEQEHRPVSISDCCVASNVPKSTALRWIKTMEAAGLARETPDDSHGRRVLVTLTPAASENMRRWLEDVSTPPAATRTSYSATL